ncbi:peptidylprolyl isomerase [Rubritalea sp.]|uniref:peptidylprolyl isomerase n=1 Tax=Rubritalea sp. TaxID=2109375 RepID=UPI003EF48C54
MGKKFVVRLFAWSVLMLYLVCDLVFFSGPLKQQVNKIQNSQEGKMLLDQERGIVARVFTVPIYLSQVDYGVDEFLWRSGRSRIDISKKERSELRMKVLDELIDHSILREKVSLNDDRFPVSKAEITSAIQRFSSRFSTPEQMAETLKSFGFKDSKELEYRIAARIQQNKYIASKIAPGLAVSDDEANAWYHDHIKELSTPERINARHIFLSKLNHTEEQALTKLEKAKRELSTKKFSHIAEMYSADARNNKIGGELKWMQRDRLPKNFAEQVFSLPLHRKEIIETETGWHLIEITDKLPTERVDYEQLKPEIVAALETTRRKSAIEEYRNNLRKQHPEKIVIYNELINSDWTH